jgi:hypothetical protein
MLDHTPHGVMVELRARVDHEPGTPQPWYWHSGCMGGLFYTSDLLSCSQGKVPIRAKLAEAARVDLDQ